jgi:hypothetical protein
MRKWIYGLAACLLATPAAAYDPPYVWVGSMILLSTTDCGGGGTQTVTIIYRPKLQAGEENSTLSYLFAQASGTVRKSGGSQQFNGSGAYDGTFVTGYAQMRSNTGTFDLDVRPAEVTPDTKFIRFTGTFTNFVGVDGCTAKVRGSAARLQ